MLIFWRLVLGHLLADFTFQSNFINSWKRRSLAGMLVHCGMHPLAYVCLAYPYLSQYWVQSSAVRLNGWACVVLIFLLHFLEDEWRVFSVFRTRAADNTLYFLWDQVFHYTSIFVFLPIGLSDTSDGWFPERWAVLACLFVVVTHFTTILVFFLEKDLWGTEFPDFDEKYITMAGRVVLCLCLMLPGLLSIWTTAAWIAVAVYLRRRRVIEYSWFSLSIGGALGALCGLAARAVYYGQLFA